MELQKTDYDLSRFIDNLKEAIVTKNKNSDEAISTVLFYSTTNNMDDKWKQVINSSRLDADKKVPRLFYIDLTKVPEYTHSDNPLTLESSVFLETLKNLIRNEDKEVLVTGTKTQKCLFVTGRCRISSVNGGGSMIKKIS